MQCCTVLIHWDLSMSMFWDCIPIHILSSRAMLSSQMLSIELR